MSKPVNLKIQLIRYTPNPEATIAASAKLCYSCLELDDIVQKADNKDNSKFIDMLIKMNHLSPLEHASFTFGIEGVSRAMLAQITRHRIASFSVRSQRYVDEQDFAYIIPPSIEALGESAIAKYQTQMNMMSDWYREWQKELGGKGEKANEDARFVLPNAAETKMIFTMNARELFHFFELRACERAQWEIRAVAWAMLEEVLMVAPNIFKHAGPSCTNKGCHEGDKTCGRAGQVISHWKQIVEQATKIYMEQIKDDKQRGFY